MASSSPAVGVSAAAAGSTEFENTGLPDPELIRFSSLLEERGGEVVGSEWRHQQYYTKKDSIASLISEMPGPKRPLNCSSRFVLVQNSGGISSSFQREGLVEQHWRTSNSYDTNESIVTICNKAMNRLGSDDYSVPPASIAVEDNSAKGLKITECKAIAAVAEGSSSSFHRHQSSFAKNSQFSRGGSSSEQNSNLQLAEIQEQTEGGVGFMRSDSWHFFRRVSSLKTPRGLTYPADEVESLDKQQLHDDDGEEGEEEAIKQRSRSRRISIAETQLSGDGMSVKDQIATTVHQNFDDVVSNADSQASRDDSHNHLDDKRQLLVNVIVKDMLPAISKRLEASYAQFSLALSRFKEKKKQQKLLDNPAQPSQTEQANNRELTSTDQEMKPAVSATAALESVLKSVVLTPLADEIVSVIPGSNMKLNAPEQTSSSHYPFSTQQGEGGGGGSQPERLKTIIVHGTGKDARTSIIQCILTSQVPKSLQKKTGVSHFETHLVKKPKQNEQLSPLRRQSVSVCVRRSVESNNSNIGVKETAALSPSPIKLTSLSSSSSSNIKRNYIISTRAVKRVQSSDATSLNNLSSSQERLLDRPSTNSFARHSMNLKAVGESRIRQQSSASQLHRKRAIYTKTVTAVAAAEEDFSQPHQLQTKPYFQNRTPEESNKVRSNSLYGNRVTKVVRGVSSSISSSFIRQSGDSDLSESLQYIRPSLIQQQQSHDKYGSTRKLPAIIQLSKQSTTVKQLSPVRSVAASLSLLAQKAQIFKRIQQKLQPTRPRPITFNSSSLHIPFQLQ